MPDRLTHWHAIDVPALAAGDAVAARRWAEAAVHDELQRSRLRALVHELAPGVELGQSSDHQLVDALVAAIVSGRLQFEGAGQRKPLLALAPTESPASAAAAPPPPPAAASPAAAAPAAAPPPAADSTFGAGLDAAAMAQALRDAAQDGVPFCEECERARQQREAQTA